MKSGTVPGQGGKTMKTILNGNLNRRGVLGAGIAAAGVLAMPSILRAQDKSLKVGVYGGYFK